MNPSTSSTILYNGAVKLDFEPGRHTYTVTDERGTRNVPSVTQALGIIDKSGPLTQWAANSTVEYLRAAIRPGARYDEIQLGTILDQARFNFRSVSKGAKAVGQLAHEWIEAYNRNLISAVQSPAQPLPINEQARSAITAAVSWISQHFKPLSMEHRIYSREHEFAGTLDVLGDVDGEIAIVDWKAAGAIYREFRLQTAAYAQAWAEMNDDRVPDRWVIRLDKESGEFEAVKFPREDYRRDLQGFLAAKQLHLTLEAIKTPRAAPKVTPVPEHHKNVISPAVSRPGPMAPPPARMPVRRIPATMLPSQPVNPLPPAARTAPRIEGFAQQQKGPASAVNGNEARAFKSETTPATSYAPRRSYNRPKSAPKINWIEFGGALVLTGATFQMKGTLLDLGGQRSKEKTQNGEERWIWQIPAQQYQALVCACNENGIRLIRADEGRAA